MSRYVNSLVGLIKDRAIFIFWFRSKKCYDGLKFKKIIYFKKIVVKISIFYLFIKEMYFNVFKEM